MSDNEDNPVDLEKLKKKFKPKKKLAVPAELLDNAKSYDDKLAMVRILSEREKNRVVLMFKNMLKDAVQKRDRR